MTWAIAVQLGLLAPVIAALGALALKDAAGERTFPSVACVIGGGMLAAGAIAGAAGRQTEWRGFDVNPWSGLLGAGVLLCAAAVALRTNGLAKRAALMMVVSATVAAVLAPDRLWLGVLIATGSVAHGVALAAEGKESRTRARTLALDCISAGLIVFGLALKASDSLRFEDIDGWASAFLLAGGLIRLGVFGTPAADDAWPMAFRAQGAFVCAFAGMGEAGLVAPAVAGLLLATMRLWARPAPGAVETVHCALVALGFGIGGAVATTGSAMLLAALFAASAARLSGANTLARPLLSFAPAGGAFLGAVMVTGAATRLAATRDVWLAAAIPGLVALCVAAVSAWRMEPDGREPATRSAVIPVLPALVVLGVLAFAPAFAVERAAGPLSAAAGAAPALSFTAEAVTETAGVAAGGLALIGLLTGALGATKLQTPDLPPIPPEIDVAEAEHPGLWGPAVRVAAVAMLACAVWLTLAAGNRGWL